jgi:NAD(P)-dependent dehydrogenase (short-subunit alcohol dehydrogenase family)
LVLYVCFERDSATSGKLQGKATVIGGVTTGIWLAAAKRLVREGTYVFITGRPQKELDEAFEGSRQQCNRRSGRCGQTNLTKTSDHQEQK